MYPVSQEFQEKILAPERRVLGKVEIEYMKKTEEFAYNDPCLTYTGNWAFEQEEGGEGTWGVPVYYATEEGASVEFEFFGTEVHIKTFTWMQDRGIVHCYIDGKLTNTIDLRLGGNLMKWTLAMHEGKLERGHHTAKVVCAGESGEFSAGTRVDVAGFVVIDEITETYEGDDIFYIRLLEEREDVEAGTIPVGNISANEIDIRLDNSDHKFDPENINSPLYGLLKSGLKVRAWLGMELDNGEKEWVPLGVFYTISWDAPEDSLYCHVTARDRLDQLRETDYTSSKAIVAASALPAPVFTRASTAYKEDGTQVAANVPRFTPQSENMFDGVVDSGVQKLTEIIDSKETTVYKLDASTTTEIMSLNYYGAYPVSPGVTYRARFKAKWNKRLTFEIWVMSVTRELIEIVPVTWVKNPEPDINKYQEYEWTVTMPDGQFEEERANSCYIFRWYYPAEDNDGIAYLADIRLNAPGAVLIEEETKNKWTNGDFEKDSDSDGLADGWLVNQTGHSFWQYRDDYNWQVSSLPEGVNGSTPGIYRDVTLEAGTWVLSFYARVYTDRGVTVRVQYDDWNGAYVVPLTGLPYNGGRAEKHIISFTLSSTRKIRFATLHEGDPTSRSSRFSLARFQLEKDACTSFTPTTRKAETLTVPAAGVLDTQEGTIDILAYVGEGMRTGVHPVRKRYLLETANVLMFDETSWTKEDDWGICLSADPQTLEPVWRAGGLTFPDDLSEGYHRFTLRWQQIPDSNDTLVSVSVDGVVRGLRTVTTPEKYKLPGRYFNDVCHIGCPADSHLINGGRANTYIDEVRFSSAWRTDEEVSAFGDPNVPLPVDHKTTLYMGMDGDFTVQPTGIQLYALAKDILQDAGLTEDEYYIDPKLRDILVPASYFEPQSHREALRKVAEAGLAVAYCDRENGKIRVEIPEAPAVEEIEEVLYIQGASFPAEMTAADVYGISADDYFQKTNPEAMLANQIAVTSHPLVVGDLKQVYESAEPVHLEIDEEKTITVFYDAEPCINAQFESSNLDAEILSARQYTWGASIKLRNKTWLPEPKPVDTVITVKARPLEVKGKQKITAKDETSITENGLRSYKFPDNPLVQSREVAQLIADNLLAVYSPARRDVELDWRGNPALELGDVVCVPEYQRDGIDIRGYYIVVKQEIEWDGGLRATLVGRKIEV